AREGEAGGGDQADVQPRDGEHVHHAGARERLAQVRVDALLVADDERAQHRALGGRDGGGHRPGEPLAPALEARPEPAGAPRQALDLIAVPRRGGHAHALAGEAPDVVEAARVLEVARRPEPRLHAEPLAVAPAAWRMASRTRPHAGRRAAPRPTAAASTRSTVRPARRSRAASSPRPSAARGAR